LRLIPYEVNQSS